MARTKQALKKSGYRFPGLASRAPPRRRPTVLPAEDARRDAESDDASELSDFDDASLERELKEKAEAKVKAMFVRTRSAPADDLRSSKEPSRCINKTKANSVIPVDKLHILARNPFRTGIQDIIHGPPSVHKPLHAQVNQTKRKTIVTKQDTLSESSESELSDFEESSEEDDRPIPRAKPAGSVPTKPKLLPSAELIKK